MIGWAVTFVIIALVAMVLGLSGVAGFAMNIAWLFLVVGIVLFIISAIGGRPAPVA